MWQKSWDCCWVSNAASSAEAAGESRAQMLQLALLFLCSTHTVLMPSWDSLVPRRPVLLHPCPGGGVMGVPHLYNPIGAEGSCPAQEGGTLLLSLHAAPAWERASSPLPRVPTTPRCWFPTSTPSDEEEKGLPHSLTLQPFSFLHAASPPSCPSLEAFLARLDWRGGNHHTAGSWNSDF